MCTSEIGRDRPFGVRHRHAGQECHSRAKIVDPVFRGKAHENIGAFCCRRIPMSFNSLDEIRAFCRDLPRGKARAAKTASERQAKLTKPPGSLGRLEELATWMAYWQGREIPSLAR